MGHRFQAFLIARLPRSVEQQDGERVFGFQCVGAIHHQWCDKWWPLQALHRFFSLLRVDENAAIVREELHSLAMYLDPEFKEANMSLPEFFNPAVPCPYTASLLSISWTIDLQDRSFLSGSSFTASLLDARKSCWEKASIMQNDEGICVIDITVIDNPAYCFVHRPGGRVLSAYQYLRQCAAHIFGLREPREGGDGKSWANAKPGSPWNSGALRTGYGKLDIREPDEATDACSTMIGVLHGFWALVDLAGYPLIEAATLRDAWPKEIFKERSGAQPLKIPHTDELPMPLDIVISLYIGLAPAADLEAIKHEFEAEEYHTAIGKVILPPYDMYATPEAFYRRTSAIRRILANPRSFEYIVEPHYVISWATPPNSQLGKHELIAHWSREYRRLGGEPVLLPALLNPFLLSPANIAADYALQVVRLWLSHPIHAQLGKLIHPAKMELKETTFLDLSDVNLTAAQVIDLVQRHPSVEAVSLSRNYMLKSSDIPFIVSSIPSLKRLHVMHRSDLGFQAVLIEHAAEFKQLEALLCPVLLTCPGEECDKPNIPISFTFLYGERVSLHPPPLVSVPLCTPAQIVQALTEILPHAFEEQDYGDSARLCREYGSKAFLESRPRPPRVRSMVMASHTFPFYMSANMLIHAALSSGVHKPGEPWSERRIVNLPIVNVVNSLPDDGEADQKGGNWMFMFIWSAHRDYLQKDLPRHNTWAFVYGDLIRVELDISVQDESEGQTTFDEQTARQLSHDEEPAPGFLCIRRTPPNLKTYDLRGFLRCMADEGRPLPDEEAVRRLEEILDTRDTVTGDLVCPLAQSHEIPPTGALPAQAAGG
ncbi:hypothetical protein ONZ51_g11192 [Trametes cubensis]|uniref:Uncharacterized protein n=1 Tax=Trametes cubensis TaxID=1111947 RepID=A0AAD7TI35_9APHY|nr:hypothetical protein ONZ51_g11192 [Trametes cubensis]